jgi:hypothetical protein
MFFLLFLYSFFLFIFYLILNQFLIYIFDNCFLFIFFNMFPYFNSQQNQYYQNYINNGQYYSFPNQIDHPYQFYQNYNLNSNSLNNQLNMFQNQNPVI